VSNIVCGHTLRHIDQQFDPRTRRVPIMLHIGQGRTTASSASARASSSVATDSFGMFEEPRATRAKGVQVSFLGVSLVQFFQRCEVQ